MSQRAHLRSRISRLTLFAAMCAVLCASLGLVLAVPVAAEEPDTAAAARGKNLFRAYCGSCHGASAVGDGDVAQWLDPKPADLTRIAERNEGEFNVDLVMAIIDGRERVKGHGRGEMPVWGDSLQVASGGATEEEAEAKIRDLAHYLWTIQQ